MGTSASEATSGASRPVLGMGALAASTARPAGGAAHQPVVAIVAPASAAARDLAQVLGRHGFATTGHAGVGEALDALRARRPDALLVSLDLDDEEPWQLLAAIASTPQLRSLPVVVLSGVGDDAEVVRALEAGAQDVLRSPFAPAELVARVRAATRVSALEVELRRRNNELDAFAQRASHDLKSPLAIINGMAETLELAWDRLDSERRDDLLRTISSNAARAATMVGDLLALARAEPESGIAGRCDPEAVVAGAIADATVRPGDRLEVEGSFADIAVPAAELASVMGNLLENAHHYGRCPDGRLLLTVRGAVGPASLVLHVEDAGAGIPDDAARKIFEPFARMADSRERNPGSSGIGLAIVRRGVERWGGTVTVERSEAGGARFVLDLPLAVDAAAGGASAEAAPGPG